MTQQQRHSPTASALMTQNRSQCQRCSLVTLLWSAGCDQCGSFPCSLSELMSHSVARSHNLSPVPPASRSGPWTAFLVHLAAASTWCLSSDIDIYWSLFFFSWRVSEDNQQWNNLVSSTGKSGHDSVKSDDTRANFGPWRLRLYRTDVFKKGKYEFLQLKPSTITEPKEKLIIFLV